MFFLTFYGKFVFFKAFFSILIWNWKKWNFKIFNPFFSPNEYNYVTSLSVKRFRFFLAYSNFSPPPKKIGGASQIWVWPSIKYCYPSSNKHLYHFWCFYHYLQILVPFRARTIQLKGFESILSSFQRRIFWKDLEGFERTFLDTIIFIFRSVKLYFCWLLY